MQNHDIITFHYNGKTLKYQVVGADNKYILCIREHGVYLNSEIFNLLGIEDKNAFCEDIVGYHSEGDFPEMKSLEDLEKIVNALYQRISEFEKTYKLNFNVKPLKF